MQELAIRTYLVLGAMADRLGELRQERGQTAAEYIGVIAFVAAIVAVLVTQGGPIAETIVGKVQEFIAKVGS
jgi:Flp pilus assembly pilin Flp